MVALLIKFVRDDNTILYVGEAYDWRLQKNGLDGFSGFEGKLTTIDDFARDGGTTENIRLDDKSRTIKICNVNWQNADNERQKFKAFFSYGRMYSIYITQGSDTRWQKGLLYRAQINEPTNKDYLLKATLTFEFDSPYLLSVDNFGRDIASLTPHIAFPWISIVNKGTYNGVFNFERSVTLINDGDNIAYPKIKVAFRGEVENPKVSINEGFIRVLGTYDTTDYIEIDYTVNPPRITNNGENILGLCDRASDFDNMYILIGENTVSFDADNGTDEMSVSVYYNRLYTML